MDLIETVTTWFRDGEFYKIMLPLYVGMILTERAWYLWQHQRYNGRDAWANVGISTFSMVYSILTAIVFPFAIYTILYNNFRLFTLPNNGWGWLGAFLIHDLIYYIDHRISHRTGLFWAFHSVHHSSEEFNFTVAARGFFLDGILTQPLYYLMPILGMSPYQIAAVLVFKSLFGIFNHTRLVGRMGWLEHLLCTPSNHRVHHGTDAKYLDRNYGQVLIIWDRLFGSYQREEEEPHYGLTTNINTHNIVAIELAGLRWLWAQMKTADNWRDRLRYLYMPPGWRHNGPGQTAEELRAHHTRQLETLLG